MQIFPAARRQFEPDVLLVLHLVSGFSRHEVFLIYHKNAWRKSDRCMPSTKTLLHLVNELITISGIAASKPMTSAMANIITEIRAARPSGIWS